MRTFRSARTGLLLSIATAQILTGADAPALKGVHDRYATIRSVSMRATGSFVVAFKKGDSPASAKFSITYLADGSNFRLNYRSNSVLGLAGNVQVARDGDTWQRLDEASSVLSYTTRDERRSGAAGPNPLFLPVLFLTPDNSQCPLCDIRLSDLIESLAGRVSDRNSVFVKAQSPRDSWEYQVTLDRIGNSVVPVVVQRRDRSGKVLVEVMAKDFRDFGDPVGMIPMTIETRSFAEDGAVDSQGTWTIAELQINTAIDPSLFRFSQNDAEIVIDDDTGVILKHPLSGRVGHSIKDFAEK